MTTETPRTNLMICTRNIIVNGESEILEYCEPFKVAELERELNELRKDNENLIDLIIMTIPEIKDLHDEIGCELETCSTLCILDSLRTAIDKAKNK